MAEKVLVKYINTKNARISTEFKKAFATIHEMDVYLCKKCDITEVTPIQQMWDDINKSCWSVPLLVGMCKALDEMLNNHAADIENGVPMAHLDDLEVILVYKMQDELNRIADANTIHSARMDRDKAERLENLIASKTRKEQEDE